MKYLATMLLALASSCQANYKITPLKGNIYIIGINFTSNSRRLAAIDSTIGLAESAWKPKCASQYKVHLVRSRYNRLAHKNNILSKLLGKQSRNKRC